MAPTPTKVTADPTPTNTTNSTKLKKLGFDKEVNYDNMANLLIEQGADRRIHESMTNDQNPESLKKLYDEFAREYDGAYDAMLYESPKNVAQTMCDMLSLEKAKSSTVLDAGCGTGKNGFELRKILGNGSDVTTTIHGIDLSTGMLEVAEKTGAYNILGEANLLEPLNLPDNHFDAVVSTGVFTGGHVKKEAIRELARVTKSDGYIIIACQELVFESEGYVPFLDMLKSEGIAQLDNIKRSFTMKKANTECNILVIKVL